MTRVEIDPKRVLMTERRDHPKAAPLYQAWRTDGTRSSWHPTESAARAEIAAKS